MRPEGKNKPNWLASEDDYELVFIEVDGMWREVGHNLPKYNNMLLCDYLNEIGIQVPDYCQFMRVIDYERDFHFEWRAYGNRVRIDVHTIDTGFCSDGY